MQITSPHELNMCSAALVLLLKLPDSILCPNTDIVMLNPVLRSKVPFLFTSLELRVKRCWTLQLPSKTSAPEGFSPSQKRPEYQVISPMPQTIDKVEDTYWMSLWHFRWGSLQHQLHSIAGQKQSYLNKNIKSLSCVCNGFYVTLSTERKGQCTHHEWQAHSTQYHIHLIQPSIHIFIFTLGPLI